MTESESFPEASPEPTPSSPMFPPLSGDAGRTVFGQHGELDKTDVRVVAYADSDEANAAISVAIAIGGLGIEMTSTLTSVQNDLVDLIADLSVPLEDAGAARARIQPSHVQRLMRAIDHFDTHTGDVSGIVLPGGTVAAALLYQARAVTRRAERSVWAAIQRHPDSVNPLTAQYLNRVSSLLFVLARAANVEHGDVRWEPEASARAMAAESEGGGEGVERT